MCLTLGCHSFHPEVLNAQHAFLLLLRAPPGVFLSPSPWAWIDPGAFALIGAGAFMGGVTRLTISLAVIMMEVSNGDLPRGTLQQMATCLLSCMYGVRLKMLSGAVETCLLCAGVLLAALHVQPSTGSHHHVVTTRSSI